MKVEGWVDDLVEAFDEHKRQALELQSKIVKGPFSVTPGLFGIPTAWLLIGGGVLLLVLLVKK